MEIKVPAVGESVVEALVARWIKQNGDAVQKDEPICELETDKITLEVQAEASGVLTVLVPEGETVRIGAVIGSIDEKAGATPPPPGTAASPHSEGEARPATPAGRKLARELGIATEGMVGSGRGGRVTPEDIRRGEGPSSLPEAPVAVPPPPSTEAPVSRPEAPPAPPEPPATGRVTRKPMTPIRKRIAERLVGVRQHTAMLTTFNEADLTEVLLLRKKHGEQFQKRHQVKLGFMSLFIRACCQALQEFPEVNASIEGDDIVYHHYCDIGVAIGAEKGLVVPVIRGAESLTLAQLEQAIATFTLKLRENRLAVSDLEGGTFTITNGGVYGSLLSTPILNPPQSGVLGMHTVQERPVARDGAVVIRPMMYLALSYDHRIVDGKGAVSFLKRVKEYIEEPEGMLLEA